MTFELEGIVAGYGDHQVLRDVSIRVPDASVVALLGPNGAGKTTLLRVASGLLRPTAGVIRYNGAALQGKPADAFARHGICHVPEGRGIFRSLTVKENLLLHAPAANRGAALERAIEVFPRLGQRLKQRAGNLSGGEQQMLAVVRAYLANPSLVLLDEVSLGLAPIVIDEIFAFLAQLAAAGASLLLVEQYIARALKIANAVFILNQGEIAFAGKPEDLDEAEVYRAYLGAEIA